MTKRYRHLDPYHDLYTASRRSHPVHPTAAPGRKTQNLFRRVLSFTPGPEKPRRPRVEKRWVENGVQGQLITWSVGYGPRTEAWLLKPADADEPLPGVVALHDHGGFKYFGKEKIADGPSRPHEVLKPFRRTCYGGRAFANELAKQGFVVLVPDVFLWGSRKFGVATLARVFGRSAKSFGLTDSATHVETYNQVAADHEHIVEKYLTNLGTTLAGVVSFEDRVAAAYLAGRKDVKSGGIACVGLSGGGMRSVLLQGSCDRIRAAVVVGAMSTYEGLLDHNMNCHTWMFFPSGWSRHGDWADIAACRAPSPLMVQYDEHDGLYTMEGQRAAHRRIAAHYRSVGKPRNHVGRFYPGPHKFDRPMQADAFRWLRRQMG